MSRSTRFFVGGGLLVTMAAVAACDSDSFVGPDHRIGSFTDAPVISLCLEGFYAEGLREEIPVLDPVDGDLTDDWNRHEPCPLIPEPIEGEDQPLRPEVF